MRERGLKYTSGSTGIIIRLSLPMRERGLKYHDEPEAWYSARVAPHAGAWIEMTLATLCRFW